MKQAKDSAWMSCKWSLAHDVDVEAVHSDLVGGSPFCVEGVLVCIEAAASPLEGHLKVEGLLVCLEAAASPLEGHLKVEGGLVCIEAAASPLEGHLKAVVR